MSVLCIGEYVQQYRITRLIGEGGMGAVYEAVDEHLGTKVAVKVLHPRFARNESFISRFFDEAHAVNQIGHPATVQIFECGFTAKGIAFLIMEYIHGETLDALLQRHGGRLQPAEVCAIGALIAEALRAVHQKGVIHRDLKPDNVMLTSDEAGTQRIKLLDFGIAKFTRGDRAPEVREGDALIGTPSYMSPEQCRGASEVDARTDLYALGILMYVMLSGRLPILGMNDIEIMARQLLASPIPLSILVPEAPAALAWLVHELLAKEASHRPDLAFLSRTLRRLRDELLTRSTRREEANQRPLYAAWSRGLSNLAALVMRF